MPRSHESYSKASHSGWETRWDKLIEEGRFDELGPKGQAYLAEQIAEGEEDEEDIGGDWFDFDFDYDIPEWEEGGYGEET